MGISFTTPALRGYDGDTMRSHRSRSSVRRFPLALAAILLCPSLAFSAVGLSAAAPAPRSQRHEFRHQIRLIEQQWRVALLRQDTQSLANLLNSDYIGISANGTIKSRSDTLAEIQSGAFRITQLTLSDQKIRLFPQTAVVTSVAELHGSDGQTSLDGRYRYTHVYVRDTSGRWTIASFEASPVTARSNHARLPLAIKSAN